MILFILLTPLKDHYYKRRRLYDQEVVYLRQDVCTNSHVRIQTNLVNRCDAAMVTVFGASPLERAISDTIESLHPCGNGRCDSILAAVGISTMALFSIAAIVVFALLGALFLLGVYTCKRAKKSWQTVDKIVQVDAYNEDDDENSDDLSTALTIKSNSKYYD